MKDFPFAECVVAAQRLIMDGLDVHQKFTCAACGFRMTMETKNMFFENGTCERCNTTTDIKRRGCNYAVMASRHDIPG